MAINDNKTALKSVRQRNYLARDFDGFRAALLDYARQYYPDRIQDFSESSVGGLFLDMAAYIGDNMSFYIDHLYGELNPETVVETTNIERTLRSAGVPIVGASSAIASVDFYIEVPVLNDGKLTVDHTLLPTIQAGTKLRTENATTFTLLEDIHFWHVDETTGVMSVASDVEVANGRRISGEIISKILKKSGTCGSGEEATDTFSLGEFVKFRRLTLSQPDVTQIISVSDGLGNKYYEVENLTHDVVYKNVSDSNGTNSIVKDQLKVIPAPYRYIREVSLGSRNTTLTLGGGSANSLEDDVIPDPSEFAIPLPYSQTFSRISLNPEKLLQTSTLGVSAVNTTLTISYRYGGGLSHNVDPNTIRTITSLVVSFPENPLPGLQSQIKNSVEASNPERASGGEDAPSANDLLALVRSIKNSQERIVTKEDLLARVYTMPSNFGRVFRASVSNNPDNPMASRLFIVSRDKNDNLIPSPDSLKINLKRYLNSYRMVSDAIDILDAPIINLELFFKVVVDPTLNKNSILQGIIKDLQSQFNIKKFHIGQPIVISDIVSTIFARKGVVSVDSIKLNNLSGTVKNLSYSPITYDVALNTRNQIIQPPDGGIFEIRYPDINIVGRAVSNV